MRYFYEPKEDRNFKYGEIYFCHHPLYQRCTLYRRGNLGLSVIQQRFNPDLKIFWWGPIDGNLVDDIYENPLFESYFIEHSGVKQGDIFPTVKIRQIMWALKMKPLKKEPWEQKLQSL